MGPSICCLALHLLCPVGGLERTPCWHVCPCHSARLPFQRACYEHFVWSQVGSLYRSSCCTSASEARLPVRLVLVGAHYQLHLLVVQVICYCWYQLWLYRKKSSRPRGRARLHGVEQETPSLDSNVPDCRALVGGGLGPCGSFVFLSGHCK